MSLFLRRLRAFSRKAGRNSTKSRSHSVSPLNLETLEDRRLLAANVTFHGGPLLQNVQVESVYYGQPWTTDSTLQQQASQTDGFLQYFTSSPYLDALAQYNVGHGSFVKNDVISQNPSGSTIDDSRIRNILNSQITGGQLSQPNGNSLYIFFTAPGVTVTDGKQNSIKDFAGYHDVFQDTAGDAVYYAVIPYPTGNVSSLPLTNFQQETLVLSHEIAEAVTDPDTQSGWFDGRTGNEIGDIAEGTSGVLSGYVVQGVWSQTDHKVVIPSDSANSSLEVEGTHLSATAGQSFSNIVATITGAPASATADSFTARIAWGDGTTSDGVVAADPNGGFDVSGTHTYAAGGSFQIKVTVKDGSGGVVGTALSSARVTAPLPPPPTLFASGVRFQATSGTAFTGTVATFTDVDASAPASNFTATITWGDGTTSDGTVVADPNGGFDVTGTHTYNTSGTSFHGLGQAFGISYFVVKVTIQDTSANSSATALSLAAVKPAPPNITAKGENIQATAGQVFNGTVATFTDVNAGAVAADFTATINWGDGTSSPGVVVADPNGGFDVTGTHTYTSNNFWGDFWFGPGGSAHLYLVTTSITDTKTNDAAAALSLAAVAPKPPNLSVTANNIQATSGQLFSGVVATFTDLNASAVAGDFAAVIKWGDGTTSAGTVVADPKGGFDVTGTHTYTLDHSGDDDFGERGNGAILRLSVFITSKTGDTAKAQALVNVIPAPSSIQAAGTVINAVAGTAFDGTAATFTSSDANAVAGSFTASIDWGDGTTSTGTVVADPKGGFDVTGTHTYSGNSDGTIDSGWNPLGGGSIFHVHDGQTPTFVVTVTITDTLNGDVAAAIGLARVTATAPNITATGQNITATAGTAFSGTVSSFTDTTADAVANYKAVINWGDGTTSRGVVTANANGGFDVTGTHSYVFGGTYSVFVSIQDKDGDSPISLGSAAVADAATPSTLGQVDQALVHSAEYLGNLITQDYQQYLARTPGSSEVAGWVATMQHGATDVQVLASILGSPEYFSHSGNSAKSWVDSLYKSLLGRNADAGGEQFWIQQAASSGMGNIALRFETSPEHESIVVQKDYQTFLGRSAGASEISGWVNAFEGGTTNQALIASFVGSQEYFQKQNANARDWLFSAYQQLLSRKPDQAGLNNWLSILH